MKPSRLVLAAAFALVLVQPRSAALAGALDRTCTLDGATLSSDVRVSLVHPRTCPPGDLVVTNTRGSFVLSDALWSRWLGNGRLPTHFGGFVVWLQADGDRSLLRATRTANGATVTLARGSFLPEMAQSGHWLAVAESRDPIPRNVLFAIPHRVVVVDFADPDHPALAASQPQSVAGEALEHFFDVRDTPGAFWFLLTGPLGFHVGRWRDGVTNLVAFSGEYRSYANLAIDPVVGRVAFAACARAEPEPQCAITIASLDGRSKTVQFPTRVAASPLPWEGVVTRLVSLTPTALTYEWMSLTTYATETRTMPTP